MKSTVDNKLTVLHVYALQTKWSNTAGSYKQEPVGVLSIIN